MPRPALISGRECYPSSKPGTIGIAAAYYYCSVDRGKGQALKVCDAVDFRSLPVLSSVVGAKYDTASGDGQTVSCISETNAQDSGAAYGCTLCSPRASPIAGGKQFAS